MAALVGAYDEQVVAYGTVESGPIEVGKGVVQFARYRSHRGNPVVLTV
jgi:hypothetical protein